MELGTGVFLSALFLGTVALFVATKDRWNWKKIFLWPLGILLGLSVVGGTVGYLYTQYEERPKEADGLWGIKLGASRSDVKFVRGEPLQDSRPDAWIYKSNEHNEPSDGAYLIRFKYDKVRSIEYHGLATNAPSIQRIDSYSSPERLVEKFGQPSFISRHKDGLQRLYSFEKFNVFFEVEKNGITTLGVYDASTGPMRYTDEAVEPNAKIDSAKP